RRTETSSWITLDDRDNDPARFWMHLSYAFDRLFAGARGAPSANDDPAQHFLRSTRELDAEATSPSYLVLDAAQVLLPEVERAVLYQEVVEPLPGDLRRFLMEIACLRRLYPAVCERVTGRTDAAELLRQLEREHACVTSDPDVWGRYDMQRQLRTMLQDELRA